MKKISIYVKDTMEKQLKEEAEKSGQSLSEYTIELIELALKIKAMKHDESRQKMDELVEKMPEYLLRLISISSETLRCVYDPDKTIKKGETADETLGLIKQTVQTYVKGFVAKEADPE